MQKTDEGGFPPQLCILHSALCTNSLNYNLKVWLNSYIAGCGDAGITSCASALVACLPRRQAFVSFFNQTRPTIAVRL